MAKAYLPPYEASLVNKSITPLPPYEDAGVKFQGKFKFPVSSTEYQIKTQQENSIVIGLGTDLAGLAAGSYYVDRGHPLQNFVIQFVEVAYYTHIWQLTRITLRDSGKFNSMSFYIPAVQGCTINKEIVPKTFKGDRILIDLDTAIPANEFVCIILYGWYEDI